MKMTLNEEIEYLQSGNWYDKVQAVLPTDEYLKLGWAIGDILETLELFRSLAPEPQTNADRIRAMSDEELSEFISRIEIGDFGQQVYGKTFCDMCKGQYECDDCRLWWLQQPAGEAK